MSANPVPSREFLRHTLATMAYRADKALRGAPAEFAAYRVGPTSRTPLEILTHINDLLDWAGRLCQGEHVWHDSTPGAWDTEVSRFSAAAGMLDRTLASDTPLGYPPETLFQGPIADALTHIGQISLLRRLVGAPVRGENYFKADIVAGRVGPEQSAPRREFD